MRFSLSLISLAAGLASASSVLAASFAPEQIINKDVAIIGGGPAGTYAAYNLKDNGTSVIIIEKQGQLGGNVNTYKVPGSGVSVEYGVHAFQNGPQLQAFFKRFNLSLVPFNSKTLSPGATIFNDMTTGQNVSFIPPTPNFTVFDQQASKYPFINQGIKAYPKVMPSDLYLPFGQFITKYGLQNETFTIYTAGQGLGNLLKIPTLFVFQYFNKNYVELVEGVPDTAYMEYQGDNEELFQLAQSEFASDILLNSTVTMAQRGTSGVSLVVNTPQGTALVQAKKLLITMRPTLSNLLPFNLDYEEQSIFSQFGYTGWYVGLMNNTGLKENTTYTNVNPNNQYSLASLPCVYALSPSNVPGIYWVRYGTANSANLPDNVVKSEMVAAVKKLVANGLGSGQNVSGEPTVIAYSSHTPMQLTVSPNAIKNDFYNNLYALQGYRSTYYSGITFITPHFTAALQQTQALFPKLQCSS